MARPPLLTIAFAIAALLAAAPAAASPMADPEGPSVYVELNLAANNGLSAHVEATEGRVTLEIRRKGRSASYEVRAEPTEAGLQAQFGKLGLIDVAFKPVKTLRINEPPGKCEGEPSTDREGLFIGTIEFTGEREYVRIEAAQAKGRMSVYRESEWQCPRREKPVRFQGAPSARQRFAAETREPATLSTFSRRCRCFFAAFTERDRGGRGPTIFVGAKLENRERMEITRLTFAYARAAAFSFDHTAGTASVRPPQPFSGNGVFKRRPHGRDLWRSTIRAPLLGADPLSVRGRGFRVRLIRDFPGD